MSKITPKLSQNLMSELKETKKMKVVDPKTVVESYTNLQKSPLRPQKVKNDLKIKSKSNFRNERNKEDESCSIA